MTAAERDTFIVAQIDAGKKPPEVAVALGWDKSRRGQVSNIYRRVTGHYPGARPEANGAHGAHGTHDAHAPEGANGGDLCLIRPAALACITDFLAPTALSLPSGISFEAWEGIITSLKTIERGSQWWLGDALNYGERAYGEKYAQAVEATGLSAQTLQNIAWVASRIPASRRREGLTWSHHAEVAAMEPAQADGWLNMAEEECLTRNELRRRIAEGRQIERRAAEPAVLPAAPAVQPSRQSPSAETPRRIQREDRPPDGLNEFFATMKPNDPAAQRPNQPPVQPDRVYESELSRRQEVDAAFDDLPPSAMDCAEALATTVRILIQDYTNQSAQRRVESALHRYDAVTG